MLISKNQNSALQAKESRFFGKDITNLPKSSLNCQKIASLEFKQQQQPKRSKETLDAINDYFHEIKKFLHEREEPSHSRMIEENSTEVTPKMKQILIDWMVDVHQSFELKEQTLHLAVLYLSDYQELKPIIKEDYQLVGITCLWIASKYEEIYPPSMKHYVQVTAYTYTASQIKKMEGEILKALDFQLVRVTPLSILLMHKHPHAKTEALAKYLIELGYLQGTVYGRYGARVMTAAAIKLSQRICNSTSDMRDLCRNTELQTLQRSEKELCLLLQIQNKYKLTALRRKFQKEKYWWVGKLKIQI